MESADVCRDIIECIDLRLKYAESTPVKPNICMNGDLSVKEVEGVFEVLQTIDTKSSSLFPRIPAFSFFSDFERICTIAHIAAVKTTAFKRLSLLDSSFNRQILNNGAAELEQQRKMLSKDYYNSFKVDTHLHLYGCMSPKKFLSFVQQKLSTEGDEVVYETQDGKRLSLRDLFESLDIRSPEDLSTDLLDMYGDEINHRFDKFNLKCSPMGDDRLREIFLKTSNYGGGKYLAEMCRSRFDELEQQGNVFIEPRVSVYGRNINEFANLAEWWHDNNLASESVHFLIQTPKVYSVHKAKGLISSFQDLLTNIFKPLFEATIHRDKYKRLNDFLDNVVGFDCVDDESKLTRAYSKSELLCKPSEWVSSLDPPYSYWMYYFYSNIKTLNELRRSLGKNTFEYRPHVGEAGDLNNLACAFLVADKINHGILLRKNASLQYLYYLCQIGIAVSPLANSKLFIDYHRNPFPVFFRRGLNVSLSTDAPLMFQLTDDALGEEYACAAHVYKLSMVDLGEIARNSVIQSSFENLKGEFKKTEVLNFGESESAYRAFFKNTWLNINKANIPNIRSRYRLNLFREEWKFLLGESSKAKL